MITRPHRYLTIMVVFLLVVGAVCALLFPRLQDAFAANAALNGNLLRLCIAIGSTPDAD